jgi:hypothetical protein
MDNAKKSNDITLNNGGAYRTKIGGYHFVSSSRRKPTLIMAATSKCCLNSDGKCNIDI